jgi:rare lipoprotein A (peptidoglycan hydrolase)
MPIRGYFLFIGPALLAFLWFVGWYNEPPRPAQPAVAAQSAPRSATQGAAQSTVTKSSGQKAQTVGVAPSPAAAAELPVAVTTGTVSSAPAAQPLPDISASTETKPADEAKPVKTATRPKKRKHLARRPPASRDGYAASGYASPYGTQYRYPQQTYASPPFFRW